MVMIVEDDPMVREMLELLFKTEGLRTTCAINGASALELITTGASEPDIVIADYNLPGGLTGLETIAKIRLALHHEIPAVILTGDISTKTLGKIADAGCTRLNKPANADELTDLISTLLAAQPKPNPNGHMQSPKIYENKLVSVKAGSDPAKPRSDLSLPTIFVVDDDPTLCATMLELLALEGRPAEAYSSCEAFLEAYRPSQKGCLLVDVQMHGMGGLALLERLKSEGCDLPTIMITGYGDVPMAVRAMKAGAVDFIEKPIDPDELIASIEGALGRTQEAGKHSAWRAAAAKCIADLTPRERMVMDMVLAGHPSKNIAADLKISQRTVENHRASIMKKTGSKSIPALIRLALAAA
jgi:two-component system CheB/CheR fusion protein